MLKKIHHKFKQWLTGPKVLPVVEALNTLDNQQSLWVINASHVLYARAEMVFSVPLAPPTEPEFPYPTEQDWAHRQHAHNLVRQQLLTTVPISTKVGDILILKDTWLPQNVLTMTSKQQLDKMPSFWSRVNDGSVLVINAKLALVMLGAPEALEEKERLHHRQQVLESYKAGNRDPDSIYTNTQLKDLVDRKNHSGVVSIGLYTNEHTIATIEKYTKG
jgi:hypothetical protein